MQTLYVTEPGAMVETEAGQLLVTKGGEVLRAVPAVKVEAVVLVGPVGLTTPALGVLLDRGIDAVLLTAAGAYRGRLTTDLARNVELRRQQYRRADGPAFCLAVGRAIVAGKIRNQRTLCLRWDETNEDPATVAAAAELRGLRDQAGTAPDLAALMGIEGRASERYFAVFRGRLRPPWTFSRRARRPPPDPVNALLSLLYTLLHESCAAALHAAGLDPAIGFLHRPHYGRASLALDLMEEFRPVVADSVVLTMLNKRILLPEDFEPGAEGTRLSRRGWRVVAEQYAHRLETLVTPEGITRRITYRRLLEVQARRLRKTITGETPTYEPFAPK